jgi:glycosyltransferase involved in cell wall biosynthesis
MARKTLLISINAAWNVYNFRRGLIEALQRAGHEIAVLAPDDGYGERLQAMGCAFTPLEMDNQGVSPGRDLGLLRRYHVAIGRIRPDLFLGWTVKPNIYGSIAARLRGVPVINNVSGLGTAFLRKGLLGALVIVLYKRALRRSKTVFFQNDEDRRLFLDLGIVRAHQARLLPGSGIDLDAFCPVEAGGGPDFLFVGRLLWDKGVREFVDAARLARLQRPELRFGMLGFVDSPNRTAVSQAELQAWVDEGLVDYLGAQEDVRPHLAAAGCIVLPSYREGLPRSLLEGAAMEKPLIAADVPGCRDVVTHGENGLLCAARDPRALADAMLSIADMSADERVAMGKRGRAIVEQKFDQRIVITRYLEAIEDALSD